MEDKQMIKVTDSIKYIGVDDKDIDLFESQYIVPNGIAYNSYVILDEKIAVMDTVDARKTDEWFENLEKELNGREPDYLVISHMEPDHAANIQLFTEKYPSATLVGNAKTFAMLPQFFDIDEAVEKLTVKE
ncbi:MAG: MBL fold metallo-hydrolase, partial [Eubacterium sp.]|nr:MBL fold metallo-hydrolase [Eubacterium sp.]